MLIHSLRRGGAERVVLELAAELLRRGDVVEVAAWVDVDEYLEPKYEYIKRHYLLSNLDYRWVRSIPGSAPRLRSLVNAFRPDVIEFHTPNLLWLAAWARLDIPCVHVLHGYEDITYVGSIKSFVYKMFNRRVHQQLKPIIITVSFSMRPFAARYLGITEDDIRIVFNGVDLSMFSAVACRPVFPPQIIMIGTLCSAKGQVMGIDAFRLLLKARPDATLVVVGDGIDMPRLRELVKDYLLMDKVRLLGRRSDVAALLANAHVLWQLSPSEAMPMVVLEAMSMGIPVVGFDVRGTRDAVLDGETGHLVPYGDIKVIAQTTITLLLNGQAWDTISRQARRRAESYFGLHTMVDNHRMVLTAATRR